MQKRTCTPLVEVGNQASTSGLDTGRSNSKKRRCNDIAVNRIDDAWPRFLILGGKDDKLSKISPFAIDKGLNGLCGMVIVKRLKDGKFFIEVGRKFQAESLLNCQVLVGCPVEVLPHRTMNSSKGVFTCSDIYMCSEDEIVDECQTQGVTHIKRFTRKRGNDITPTNTYLVTFNTPNLPREIKLGYLNCKLKPFIPSPLRCFHCQKYGHTKFNCKRLKETCPRCGTEGHSNDKCERDFKCINCAGNHPAYFKGCPRFKDESEVQKIRVLDKVSFFEARNIYEYRHGIKLNNQTTYADAVSNIITKKPTTTTIATQTDIVASPAKVIKPTHSTSKQIPTLSQSPGLRAQATNFEQSPAQSNSVAPKPEQSPVQGKSTASNSDQSPPQSNSKANTNSGPGITQSEVIKQPVDDKSDDSMEVESPDLKRPPEVKVHQLKKLKVNIEKIVFNP
jgi:hypothetical protein